MSAVIFKNVSDIYGYLGDMSWCIPPEDEDILNVIENIKSFKVDNRLFRYNLIIYYLIRML